MLYTREINLIFSDIQNRIFDFEVAALGGPLPITHVIWYFDTHLHYPKETKGFKPSFLFIIHQPDVVCKIAAIEPDSRTYLLGVPIDSLCDWVNRVQN